MIAILKENNERLFRDKNAEVLWDERLSYSGEVWTKEVKKLRSRWIDGFPDLVLQCKDVEFFETGEFARVSVRGVHRSFVVSGQDPEKGGIAFEGRCVFRKFGDGWRLKGFFPWAMQVGSNVTWKELIMAEAGNVQGRILDSLKYHEKPPSWATDEEIIRLLKLGFKLYEREGAFPLPHIIDGLYMFSERPMVRRFVYETLVRVFRVDYGYSEKLLPDGDPKQYEWFKGWREWIDRNWRRWDYAQGVPLPKQ